MVPWNTLALSVEQSLCNDIILGGMIINKEGDFGPCILWEVEIHGRGLVKKGYDTFCILCLK